MQPLCVPVPLPSVEPHLRFSRASEDFSIQKLIAEPGVEALGKAVLPRFAWLDVGGVDALTVAQAP